ncbi:STELLO glycosyltransferase family protein [Endozoicomonas sp. SCSIO W0465]|uniref:STELLO glycosyltransferase family protein n=1 Tax=Endozoicomonas sp. SCSIO W0465 TaxID=2918516 RepID=UPI0020765BD6|nr:STELLO glycosyltransferase family protein [Endozoicomonas sp. SCSIO W0465]USE33907.1 STELLO glycosyltransferase family protein [Endozoicomonas sp. SCSIO W0465]
MKHILVLTSIHGEQPVLDKIRTGVEANNWQCVIAGDTISKPIRSSESLTFYSIIDQLSSSYSYAKLAPTRNYCRKNLAYLKAMEMGADVIVETDDDNLPYDIFFKDREHTFDVRMTHEKGFINIYRYFTENQKIWPRGFSLEDIQRDLTDFNYLNIEKKYCPIQNGLVDGEPDVDAIYRLILDLPFQFEHKNRKIALSKNSWCSFNTQNTSFFKEFFPLMYHPATPMFREADIVRSFVIQRILKEFDLSMMIHSATVYQSRNYHSLIDDFRQEVRLYSYIKKICQELNETEIHSKKTKFKESMKKCYQIFKPYRIVTESEFSLIDAWFDDLELIGIV